MVRGPLKAAGSFNIYIIYTYASYELTILGIMAYDRQIYIIYTYAGYEFTILGIMAYDRQIYIIYTYASYEFTILGIMAYDRQIYIIYTYASYELTILGIMAYDRQIYIIYTYASYELTILGIMAYDRKRSSEFKRKVVRSCLPHIVTFINYSIAVFCDIALSRINLEESLARAPMEKVAVDVVGPLPHADKGNSYVLSAIDYFTKWPEAYALPDQEAER
ncbi:hypothetical protein F2P81_020943 [Scophthalmus maximus]|uniref:Uncharacterized protein n=1 Tax=Scophthalmus maximus TaxID=52904 RepID=A0A6A4RU30_SCOMX|nr:hypothetical protein F2P81_020943 [Scophthalmus maximus]